MLLGQHGFNSFCNLSWQILKIGVFTAVLANHKKGIFPLKRAFFGESHRPVRQLSYQILSFRLETHKVFLTCAQLTNIYVRYRIHGSLRSELLFRKALF